MSRTRAFKRLSTAVLTGAVVAATPFAFATPAHAAVATQVIQSPGFVGNLNASFKFDGTNSTVPLYTEITQASAPDPLAASVRWSYNQTDPTCVAGSFVTITTDPVHQTVDPTALGDVNTKVFSSVEWAPPAVALFCIRSEVLEANGVTVINTATKANVNVVQTDSTALVKPAPGGFAGVYNGNVHIEGTASATSAAPIPYAGDTGGDVNRIFDASTLKWAANPPAAAPLPTATKNAYHSVFYSGQTAPTNVPVTEPAVLYLSTLNSFAASPASANKQPYLGALPINPTTAPAANVQRYTFVALDQKGNPIAGLPVDVKVTDPNNNASYCFYNVPESGVASTSSLSGGAAAQCGVGSTATTNATPPVAAVTDAFGRFRADVANTDAEVLNFTIRTRFAGGVFNPAIDFATPASLTTATAVTTSGTAVVTGSPTFPIYASQTYSTPTGPTLTVNVKDGVGSPVAGQSVLTQTVRTILSGKTAADPNTYPKTFPLASTAPTDTNGNTTVPLNPVVLLPTATPNSPTPTANSLSTDGESGFDTVQTYVDRNGTPGFQAGDLLIDNTRINFGPERIFVLPCNTVNPTAGLPSSACLGQQKAGVDKAVNVVDTIFGAVTGSTPSYVPVTGRKLDITISNKLNPAPVPFVGTAGTDFGFSPTNPGVTVLTPTSANVTTDSTGSAGVNIFSNNAQQFVVTASDPSLGGTFTSDDGSVLLTFNSFSAVLNGVGPATITRIAPAGNAPGKLGAPGEPMFFSAPLTDQNGAPLRNETVTLNVSSGFFTAFPTIGLTYPSLSFTTPITGNAPIVGDIKSLGTTIQATTDSSGNVYGIVGTLRDAGYDATGDIAGTITATFASATKNVPVPNGLAPAGTLYSTNFARDGGAPVAPAATDALKILEGVFKNTGQFVANNPAAKPSGDKAVANVNSIPSDTISTFARQKDSFGNLVSTPLAVSSSGVGVVSGPGFGCVSFQGAFLNDFLPNTPTACRIATASNPTSDNPQLGSQTVTYTWTAPANTWLVNSTTGAVGINAQTTPLTDSYTINWYLRGATGLTVTVSINHGGGTSFPAGTPINVSATVKDDHGRAVKGLGLQFFRSGPQGESSQTPNPFLCSGSGCSDAVFTDANGTGGYTFLSTKVGGVTITTIVTDLSGNEVFRHVDHVTYTGFPRPVLSQTSHLGTIILTVTTDPSFSGHIVSFFVRSGMTGHVRSLGIATVNNQGLAIRTLNGFQTGQSLLVYAHLENATGIEDSRTTDKAFHVQP